MSTETDQVHRDGPGTQSRTRYSETDQVLRDGPDPQRRTSPQNDLRQQLVDGHGSLLRLQVRHVVLDHLVCDTLRKLLTQLFDPGTNKQTIES